MARGGKRTGAGRKPKADLPFKSKESAERILGRLGSDHRGKKLPSEDDLWLTLMLGTDLRIRLDTLKYLIDRRDGKAVLTVNHVHDKPIQMEVNVQLSEIIREVRERKREYEKGKA